MEYINIPREEETRENIFKKQRAQKVSLAKKVLW